MKEGKWELEEFVRKGKDREGREKERRERREEREEKEGREERDEREESEEREERRRGGEREEGCEEARTFLKEGKWEL